MTRVKGPILRLTRASRSSMAGKDRVLAIDVQRVDGVVLGRSAGNKTQVVMMDGSLLYVAEEADEVLRACEALGCPVGVFTREGAKEAMRDCIE
jgi:hypothetical protein